MEVAREFSKFPHEVLALSPDEFADCVALMQVRGAEEKRALAETKAKANRGGSKRPRRR